MSPIEIVNDKNLKKKQTDTLKIISKYAQLIGLYNNIEQDLKQINSRYRKVLTRKPNIHPRLRV